MGSMTNEEDMFDGPSDVIVCAGPPECLFEGDEAVANAQAGCPKCRRIVISEDGTVSEGKLEAN